MSLFFRYNNERATIEKVRSTKERRRVPQVRCLNLGLGVDLVTNAWKTYDFETMDRLHQKGYIWDPKNRN